MVRRWKFHIMLFPIFIILITLFGYQIKALSGTMEEILLKSYSLNDSMYFALDELLEQTQGSYTYDAKEGILRFNSFGYQWTMLKDAPILSKNGVYLPFEEKLVATEASIYIPVSFFYSGYPVPHQLREGEIFLYLNNAESDGISDVTAVAERTLMLQEWRELLSDIAAPFPGAYLSPVSTHWPGAPRAYRNGVHLGIDWYDRYSGVRVMKGTPVLAMMDGVVVRADVNYQELQETGRESILTASHQQNATPAYILDDLRGRSVWIQSESGISIIYAHLDGIPERIIPGATIKKGEIIGYAGNSGTSDGVKGTLLGVHAHTEIMYYGKPILELMKREDLVQLLKDLFAEKP